MPTTILIEFGPKFCQQHLDSMIGGAGSQAAANTPLPRNIWSDSMLADAHELIFDLTLTEWVATEEVVFLLAWIRRLLAMKKNISVRLPAGHDLSQVYSPAQLKRIGEKYNFTESPARVKRRVNRNIFLMINWGLLNKMGLTSDRFENVLGSGHYRQRAEESVKNLSNIVNR